ncbi:CPBP family intramembrane glutamic endopeptidase [Allofustis seminis]|uniref:CPBP family intramembrane glutamic endopeptidase n=1 Tax=Allofustis seminis TaxID=166939 RepID=UPI00039C749E|nr:type II CAAX endopeptidase family protein [Allofustis seminis]
MNKFLKIALKCLVFFTIFIGLVSVLFANDQVHDPILWRLYAEAVPFATIFIMSIVFWLPERHRFSLLFFKSPIQNSIKGLFKGVMWIGVPIVGLWWSGYVEFLGSNIIFNIGHWLLACFLNVCMQELLTRGYMYQLIRYHYSPIVAIIMTTLLFVLLHGGAVEAGILPILNVITMSLFMSFAYEATHSWLFPVMLHFAWNAVGGIILGVVNLAEDYPHIYDVLLPGPDWLTGGAVKIEGSAVVLAINSLLMLRYLLKCYATLMHCPANDDLHDESFYSMNDLEDEHD